MTDPVDRRAAEIKAELLRRQQSVEDHTDDLVSVVTIEAAGATKYPVNVDVEAQGLVIVSYWKAMFGNKVRKEVAELHVRKGRLTVCQVIFSDCVTPPAKFEHGRSYHFGDAAEIVMFATIESMAQSIAAGCAIVAPDTEIFVISAERIHYLEVTQLFRAYAQSLPIDLGYQGFDGELASLPGKYAPPAGALLIARDADGTALGCVAMRPLDEQGVCEMKRLYVAPEGRGKGVGRTLALAIIEAARVAGYREMRLDTLASMQDAQRLYRALGFTEIPAYYDSPIENTVFMSLKLD